MLQVTAQKQESDNDRSETVGEATCADVTGLTRPESGPVRVSTKKMPTGRGIRKAKTVTFTTTPSNDAPRSAKRDRQVWNACLHCSRWYAAPVKELNRGRRIYCSIECTALHATATGKFKGEKNPRWLGGVSNDNMRYRRRSKAAHPIEERARALVAQSVRTGKLVRLPCEHCGAAKANGHHEDYSKPLVVIWLCRVCHDKEHARLKAAGIEPYVPATVDEFDMEAA